MIILKKGDVTYDFEKLLKTATDKEFLDIVGKPKSDFIEKKSETKDIRKPKEDK